jgi:uncharacterized protein (TIGR03435 family)
VRPGKPGAEQTTSFRRWSLTQQVVVDHTELKGVYNIDLTWSVDQTTDSGASASAFLVSARRR